MESKESKPIASDQKPKPAREYPKLKPTTKLLRLYAPPSLYEPMMQLKEWKRQGQSGTLRMLLYMGLNEYQRRAKYGIIRRADREEYERRVIDIMEQMKAEKEARKQSRNRSKKKKAQPALLLLDGIDQTE